MTYYLKHARDPLSSFSHMIGAWMFAFGGIILFLKAQLTGGLEGTQTLALLSFTLSTVALYSASAGYHYCNGSPERIAHLRKLDHSMIYILIAGSYTPVVLTWLQPPKGLFFSIFIWSFALIGILLKLVWFHAPRWLSTGLYLVMGWSILFDISAFSRMPVGALVLTALGGLSYTAGGVIYAIKKPNFPEPFGFHEVFHLFVLFGSLMHYIMILCYIA